MQRQMQSGTISKHGDAQSSMSTSNFVMKVDEGCQIAVELEPKDNFDRMQVREKL